MLNAQLIAAPAEPDARDDNDFDFMNLLSEKGLHDLKNERFNAYGQMTYISSWKSAFPAKYTNLNGTSNSLSPDAEQSFTFTATAFLGVKTWQGGEIYYAPEIIAMRPLSGLLGLGGVIQNFELQKNGSATPIYYTSRIFFKQTINLGGKKVEVPSDPMQLGTTVDSRRLVFRIGNFSTLDFFDKNSFSGDLRRQFLNMAFLTYAAYDFAADARGYTWGGVVEYFHDDWALRYARTLPPVHPNQQALVVDPLNYYGDQIEIEHKHSIQGQSGALRLLAYHNRENSGRFDDAMSAYANNPMQNATTCPGFSYASTNSAAPDLCWARKANTKVGVGLNVEQQFFEHFGFFARGMYSDGLTEVYSYTSADRSLATGIVAKGKFWGRAADLFGVGYAWGWISPTHVPYLNMGGVDGFIGDGKITYGSEQVLDIFYSLCLYKTIWLSVDYQHITNPAFNIDRGPVDIVGLRLHTEF